MSAWLIALVGIAYVCVAIDQYLKGATGVSIMFVGYAIGQWGVYLQAH